VSRRRALGIWTVIFMARTKTKSKSFTAEYSEIAEKTFARNFLANSAYSAVNALFFYFLRYHRLAHIERLSEIFFELGQLGRDWLFGFVFTGEHVGGL